MFLDALMDMNNNVVFNLERHELLPILEVMNPRVRSNYIVRRGEKPSDALTVEMYLELRGKIA